jgi:hypothetical protein
MYDLSFDAKLSIRQELKVLGGRYGAWRNSGTILVEDGSRNSCLIFAQKMNQSVL